MKTELKHLLEEYAELEQAVQALVSSQCREVCALCTTCCCRADLCEEALESPFLRLLHGRDGLESDRYGFLTETGCALELGRPPVCYEFFCAELLAAQPDDQQRGLLRILGRLPAFAGQNARGNASLAEIRQEKDLEQVRFQILEKQLQESLQALEILNTFYNTGALPEHSRRALDRITVSSED